MEEIPTTAVNHQESKVIQNTGENRWNTSSPFRELGLHCGYCLLHIRLEKGGSFKYTLIYLNVVLVYNEGDSSTE